MNYCISSAFILLVVAFGQQPINGQLDHHHHSNNPYYYQQQKGPPPPQILTHKQALNHDGNFKYIFTSENGLVQGESIAPDGSRNGAYSYTDPTGRKISVRYTAGKEGFRILEGDHLPRAPPPEYPLPSTVGGGVTHGPSPVQHYSNYVHGGGGDENSAENYETDHAHYRTRAATAHINAPNNNEPDYNDEPGKPYSFGPGYLFEFNG